MTYVIGQPSSVWHAPRYVSSQVHMFTCSCCASGLLQRIGAHASRTSETVRCMDASSSTSGSTARALSIHACTFKILTGSKLRGISLPHSEVERAFAKAFTALRLGRTNVQTGDLGMQKFNPIGSGHPFIFLSAPGVMQKDE
jgi:hypothetical protein